VSPDSAFFSPAAFPDSRSCLWQGLQSNEVASLLVSDSLRANGAIKRETVLRRKIVFNGKKRDLFWNARYVRHALEEYLAARLANGHGAMTGPQK